MKEIDWQWMKDLKMSKHLKFGMYKLRRGGKRSMAYTGNNCIM